MKRTKLAIVTTFLISSLLVGCGQSYNSSYEADYNNAYTEDAYEMSAEKAVYSDYEEAASEESNGPAELDQSVLTDRKLIKNVYLSVETVDIDPLIAAVEAKVNALGGYISRSSISERSSGLKDCNMTIRVPAERTDEFVTSVEDGSNLTSKSENIDDVTMHYTDLEAHKKALQTEYDSLLSLLKQAESVEDIITIQGRLSEVRYEMESMESSLRLLQNQISYSTINLDITEVTNPTSQKEEGTLEMIARRFKNNLKDAIETVGDFFIDIIVSIPNIIVFVFFLILAVLVIKVAIKLIKFLLKKHEFTGIFKKKVINKKTINKESDNKEANNSGLEP